MQASALKTQHTLPRVSGMLCSCIDQPRKPVGILFVFFLSFFLTKTFVQFNQTNNPDKFCSILFYTVFPVLKLVIICKDVSIKTRQ